MSTSTSEKRYCIKNADDGSLIADFEDHQAAISHFVAVSRWNVPCRLIDTETNVVLKERLSKVL